VRVVQKEKLAKEVLEQLAKAAAWHVEWTPSASRKVEDRFLDLDIRNRPLLDLLEWSADELDLLCRQEGDVIHFATRDEIDTLKRAVLWRDMAQRALHTAISAEPGHTLAPAAYLELGNLEAAAGRHKEAALWYQQSMRDAWTSPYVLLAYFNRAQLHFRN